MPSEGLKRSRSPELDAEKSNKRPNTSSRTNSSVTRDTLSAAADDSQTSSTTHSLPAPVTAANMPASETQSSTSAQPANGDAAGAGASSSGDASSGPASQNIHMRCLIVTTDASIIIGRGGTHVNEIRDKSGARIMVSESIPGNPERILNVSGALDAVSKVRSRAPVCTGRGCWTHKS